MLREGFILFDSRELRREKAWARINLVPLLEAENDRDLIRRFEAIKSREQELMGPEWKAMDLKSPVKGIGKNGVKDENQAEPVYHTKRWVTPTLIFAPPSDKNVIDAQWWRGSTVLTKVAIC